MSSCHNRDILNNDLSEKLAEMSARKWIRSNITEISTVQVCSTT